MARLISLGILTTLIVALGITFYHVLAPFLLPLFLAWVTAILCRPLYLWTVSKTNGRPRLAAGLTTAGLLLVVLLPLALGTVFAAVQLVDLATVTLRRTAQWTQSLEEFVRQESVVAAAEWIEFALVEVPTETAPTETVPVDEFPPEQDYPDPFAPDPVPEELEPVLEETDEERTARLEREAAEAERLDKERRERERRVRLEQLPARIQASLEAMLQYLGARTIGVVSSVPGVALGVLGRVVSLLVALVMFSIALYYFLCDGPELLEAAEGLIPVHVDYQRELLARFDQVVRAVVLSTFLSALAQGFLTAVALGFAGFEHLLVFFVLASLGAMIPLAGTWLVWGPCAIWLAWYDGRYVAAGMIVAFGLIVIGTVDNLIRTYILNSSARLHPLLAFVSVLGGLQVMGLWGVFIAPVVAACLHALMQIFNTELKAFSQERTAGRHAAPDEVVIPRVGSSPADVATQRTDAGPEPGSIAPPRAASAKVEKPRKR